MSKLKFLFLGLIGSTAHASGGGVDFYQRAAGLLGVPEHFVPAFSAILSVPALFFLGLAFSRGCLDRLARVSLHQYLVFR